MLLRLDENGLSMRNVFRLDERLREDPERIRLAQELTLDSARPFMGLRGVHGLFGSPEWWDSINDGRMPLLYHSGVILRAYVTGQDKHVPNNAIDLQLKDGSVHMTGIFVNDKHDIELFRPGGRAAIVYALDELKLQPGIDGGVNYLKIALEMAVSDVM